MIKVLQIAEPFYGTEYIESEENLYVEGSCLLLNLERMGGQPLYVEGRPLYPLGSAVVKNAACRIPGRALLVRRFREWDVSDDAAAEKIREAWDPSDRKSVV